MKSFPNPLPIRLVELECEVDSVIENRITALYEGQPAGTVAVRSIHHRAGCRFWPRKVAYLYQLFVHKEVRKHGVGKALLERACLSAQVHGCYAISLNVASGNADVLPFYAKLGFVPAHQEYDGTLILCRQLNTWDPQPLGPVEVPV